SGRVADGPPAGSRTVGVHDLFAGRTLFQVPLPVPTAVSRVEFLADGRRLVLRGTARDNGHFQSRQGVLDAAPGATLADEPAAVPPRAVSPDGRRRVVVAAEPGDFLDRAPALRYTTVRVVDADGKELWTKPLSFGARSLFRFSPDGARLAAVPAAG